MDEEIRKSLIERATISDVNDETIIDDSEETSIQVGSESNNSHRNLFAHVQLIQEDDEQAHLHRTIMKNLLTDGHQKLVVMRRSTTARCDSTNRRELTQTGSFLRTSEA
jgi:hypothetical protein